MKTEEKKDKISFLFNKDDVERLGNFLLYRLILG